MQHEVVYVAEVVVTKSAPEAVVVVLDVLVIVVEEIHLSTLPIAHHMRIQTHYGLQA